MIEGDGAEEGR